MNNLDGEKVILSHLFKNSAYFYRVFPKIDEKVFKNFEGQTIIKYLKKYYSEFSKQPTLKELALYILNSSLEKSLKDKIINYFKDLKSETEIKNFDFLIDFTEKFLKKSHLTDAILESVEILKKSENLDGIDIISKFEEALNYKFDTNLGLEFNESLEERFKKYNEVSSYIPTGIKTIDELLGGGFKPGTLSLILGASHSGKSALLTAFAAGFSLQKKNGLYVTLEMSEYDILKRVDANVFDTPMYEFQKMSFNDYKRKYEMVKNYIGKLFVKEYPAGSFSTFDLEKLKYDIEQENDIKLDYIIIDYMGLMKSTRVRLNQGSYLYFKSIAEELHGFSKRQNIPVISAFQLNRSAYNNTDAGMETISESMGVIMTADVALMLLTNEELKSKSQVLLKAEKNRNTGRLEKTILAVDWPKMQFKGIDDPTDDLRKLENMMGDFGMSELEKGINFDSTIDNNSDEEEPYIHEKALIIAEDDDFNFD